MIYQNETFLKVNVIINDNLFTIFVMDGVFYLVIQVALPTSTFSFPHLLCQTDDHHQSL